MNFASSLPNTQSSTYAPSPKIAIVAPSLEILGGQGVQAADLTRALRGDGCAVISIAVNPGFPRGLRWVRRIPVLRTLLNQLLYIPALLRLRNVDVVHIFSASYWSFLISPVPAIVIARLFRKRVVLNYHSGEAADHLHNWGKRVHPWLKLVDVIVVPSEYLREVFAHHGYQTRVIRNIVDTSSFGYRERKPRQARLLSSRNLEPGYCIDNTLQAFALLKKSWPLAHLTVAGYGSEEARLREWVRANALEDVEFVGRIEPPDMPAIYDAADVFINSSIVDNQPISILEAFAAGLIVVSTPTGDIPAMVRDTITGRIVAHRDPQAMAAAISKLLQNQDETLRMTKMARAEVEKYTWPCVAEQWKKVYMGTGI